MFEQSHFLISKMYFFSPCVVWHVPDYVFYSPYFWLLLTITVGVILYKHNRKPSIIKSNNSAQTLTYKTRGRDGTVVYSDHISSISFYYELAGDNCIAVISIPSEEEWQKQTNRCLQERKQIIEFVAKQSLHDKARGGTYKILDQYIELYST